MRSIELGSFTVKTVQNGELPLPYFKDSIASEITLIQGVVDSLVYDLPDHTSELSGLDQIIRVLLFQSTECKYETQNSCLAWLDPFSNQVKFRDPQDELFAKDSEYYHTLQEKVMDESDDANIVKQTIQTEFQLELTSTVTNMSQTYTVKLFLQRKLDLSQTSDVKDNEISQKTIDDFKQKFKDEDSEKDESDEKEESEED